MKTIEELRIEFEKHLGDQLKDFKYSKKENKYTTKKKLDGFDFITGMYDVCTINGAWWMFQELKK